MDDDIRLNVREYTDDERLEFKLKLNEPDEQDKPESKPNHLKFRDIRSPALKHANQQLAAIKADGNSTSYDIHCARERIEIAAVDSRRYWDAYRDWQDWRKSA